MRRGYGHMVHDFCVANLRRARQERVARLAAISTREEAIAYQARVKETIRRAFGPRPPRTPLRPRLVGSLERPRYRIEKLVFESRPRCLVTANLYVPSGLTTPAPGVIAACGHSADGKAYGLYQGFCQRLALSGFVALIYDPFNQGERDQYARLRDREAVSACTRAHNMMGKQLELVGEFFGMWRAWDGIRALDYLLTRPEVDPERVGLTGNSGGGTMTTWLWAIEDRFSMAAPGCFVTTFLRNLENELPADCEQYPPGVLAAGLEMADFLIARAPSPALVLGQHYDYFDRRGHQEACDEVRRFYDLLGAPSESFRCFRGNRSHGYYRENQEAMLDFFAQHARIGPVQRVNETEVLDEESLYATPGGDVIAAGAKPIYESIAERADGLAAARPRLQTEELIHKLSKLLALPEQRAIPHHRVLRPTRAGDRTYARYAIETESNVRAILHKDMDNPAYAHSLDVGDTVHLYLPHYASEEDLARDSLALSLQGTGELYALDVRGLGESAPDEEGSFWQPYGIDYMFHGHGLMFGESYLGRRVYDVISTIELLLSEGAREICLYGRGQGALIALFTALLHRRVTSVTLKNAPRSYHEWTHAPLVDWPAANFLRGVLPFFDLQDCVRDLGDKVTIIEPWDARMSPAESLGNDQRE